MRLDLTEAQAKALRDIVEDWIGEGFTSPPYTDEQYDLFEALDLPVDKSLYDIRRPTSP